MSICVLIFTCLWNYQERLEEDTRSPKAGVAGSFKPLDFGAGNRTQLLGATSLVHLRCFTEFTITQANSS